MKVVEKLTELRKVIARLPEPMGLVPTMGFLHEGHLSLVRAARQEEATVAASIFVNPTQFTPAEDIEAYPRDLDRDLAVLRDEGVDIVWTPQSIDVYPAGFQTWVTVEELIEPLEGAHRPGHFRGVATVVAKLLLAFQPQRAYFGQKDAQQVAVLKRMVLDLNFPVEIVVCPTVREPDGLALSSRNSYLSEAQRAAAPVLYRALTSAAQANKNGENDAEALRQRMLQILSAEPLAKTEYVSVADPNTLEEIEGEVAVAQLSMAVKIGKARLIDNIQIGNR